MAVRRMLRDIMNSADVYAFAEPIMEMLREDYGSYDADALDEVMVEETFAQRLKSRGYEVRPWGDVPAPATAGGDVVPVRIVRQRRPMSPERPPIQSGDRPAGGDRGPTERPLSERPISERITIRPPADRLPGSSTPDRTSSERSTGSDIGGDRPTPRVRRATSSDSRPTPSRSTGTRTRSADASSDAESPRTRRPRTTRGSESES